MLKPIVDRHTSNRGQRTRSPAGDDGPQIPVIRSGAPFDTVSGNEPDAVETFLLVEFNATSFNVAVMQYDSSGTARFISDVIDGNLCTFTPGSAVPTDCCP